jgi:hypothetical protein
MKGTDIVNPIPIIHLHCFSVFDPFVQLPFTFLSLFDYIEINLRHTIISSLNILVYIGKK